MRRHWLLLAAVSVIGLFVIASMLTFVDVLFAVPMSFVIPSILNLTIAWLIVSLIPIQRMVAKFATFVIVSALLATAIEAPAIWTRIFGSPRIEQEINRTVRISSDQKMIEILGFCPLPFNCGPGNLSYVMGNPLDSQIKMSADSWKIHGRVDWKFQNPFWNNLQNEFATSTGTVQRAWRISNNAIMKSHANKVFLRITVSPHSSDAKLADIVVEVIDVQDKASTFSVLGTPYVSTMEDRADSQSRPPIFNGFYLRNMAHILSHNTFWSLLIGRWLDYFPREEFRLFLKKAIQRPIENDLKR